MKALVNFWNIYTEVKSFTYLQVFKFTYLTLRDKILYSFFIAIASFIYGVYAYLAYHSFHHTTIKYILEIFALITCLAIVLEILFHRLAFKRFRQITQREFKFLEWYDQMIYFLFRKEVKRKGFHHERYLTQALESLQVESPTDFPEPLAKNPLLLILLTATITKFASLTPITPFIFYIPLIALLLMLYLFTGLINWVDRKKTHLAKLKQYLKRMQFDMEEE